LNGDGKISKDEIEKVLGKTPNAAELIAEADINGDGTIDYDEFLTLWSAKQKPPAKPTARAAAPAPAPAAAAAAAAATATVKK